MYLYACMIHIYMQKYVARCIFPMVVLIRLQLAAVCVRLVQTTAQITNCVAANLLAKRKCLICVITAKRQYHKTYWIGAKIVGISRLFDSVCTTKYCLKVTIAVCSYKDYLQKRDLARHKFNIKIGENNHVSNR